MEEFQAAEQRTESEQAGHLVSLEEQLQAVRMKVCVRPEGMIVSTALRSTPLPWTCIASLCRRIGEGWMTIWH